MIWSLITGGLVLAVIVAHSFEKWMSSKWNHGYYSFGVPFFVKTFKKPGIMKRAAVAELSRLKRMVPSFEYIEVSESLFFFRIGNFKEIGMRFYELSFCRGYVVIDPGAGEIVSVCFLNWYLLFLICLAFSIVLQIGNILLIVASLMLIGFGFVLMLAQIKSLLTTSKNLDS